MAQPPVKVARTQAQPPDTLKSVVDAGKLTRWESSMPWGGGVSEAYWDREVNLSLEDRVREGQMDSN